MMIQSNYEISTKHLSEEKKAEVEACVANLRMNGIFVYEYEMEQYGDFMLRGYDWAGSTRWDISDCEYQQFEDKQDAIDFIDYMSQQTYGGECG